MKIETAFGKAIFDYKYDLNLEESEHYLPPFYEGRVIELSFVESHQKGGGHQVMRDFLSHEVVKSASLIFLDCSPNFMDGNEKTILQGLHRFYSAHGFVSKHNSIYERMWRIQSAPTCLAECFSVYDPDNDLHEVLRTAILKSASTQ